MINRAVLLQLRAVQVPAVANESQGTEFWSIIPIIMGTQNSKDNIIVEQSPSISTAATAQSAGLELAEILLIALVVMVCLMVAHKAWGKMEDYLINVVEKRMNRRSIQGAGLCKFSSDSQSSWQQQCGL